MPFPTFMVLAHEANVIVTSVVDLLDRQVPIYSDSSATVQVVLPKTLAADTTFYTRTDSALYVTLTTAGGTSLGTAPVVPGIASLSGAPTASQLVVSAETDVGWDDLRVSLSRATTGASNPSLTAFQGTTQAYAFSKTATNQLFFDVQLPHNWVAGSEIRPHIHWSPGASADTGVVRWQLEHTWGPINGVFPSSSTMTAVDQAAAGAYKHQICSLGAIDGTGIGVSSVLMCRVARLGGATQDTFDDVAFGLSIDFHIKTQGMGTLDEYPS